MKDNIAVKLGRTVMAVFRKDINDQTGRETINKVHEGIVVQDCGPFVRLYNHAPLDKGGDTTAEACELFPLRSRRMWCETVGERVSPWPVPPLFA